MTSVPDLTCSRCGAVNPSTRLFCRSCGLGLQLAGSAEEPRDAPLGSLYASGLVGIVAAIALSGPGLMLLLRVLEAQPDLERNASILSWYLWNGVPLLCGFVGALGVAYRASQFRLPGSWPRAALGACWLILLGLAAATAVGEIAVIGAGLLSPLGAARAGFGVLRPWTPLRRIVVWSLAILAAGGLAAVLDRQASSRVFVDQAGSTTLLGSGGTALVFEGLQAPISVGLLPPEIVGLALWQGQTVAATREGSLVPLGRGSESPTGRGPWHAMVRLGPTLVVAAEEGVLSFTGAGIEKSQLVWETSRGRPIGVQLGVMAREVVVLLDDTRMLTLSSDGAIREVGPHLPTFTRFVARAGDGNWVYGASGRQVQCWQNRTQNWTNCDLGLQVGEVTGMCPLEDGVAVASDRGLFFGRGVEGAPFRLLAAGRFSGIQSTERGALAVQGDDLIELGPQGQITRRLGQ